MRFIKVVFVFFIFFVFGCGQSDKEAYERAKLKDTVEGYQEFLQKYPKSEFRVSAKNQIKEIEDKEARVAYEYAKLKDTIEGYEEFIKKYPGNELRESAINQIEKIKEKEAHKSALSAPCYGIEVDSWKYDKPVRDWPYRDEWTPHYYTAMIKNISNRNKLVFFKYKLKGDDTWHPVTDVKNLRRLIQEDGAVKINSGNITEIRIKIEDKKNVKTIETVAIDYCK